MDHSGPKKVSGLSRNGLQICSSYVPKGKKKKPNVPSNPLERPINHLISTNNTHDWLFQQQYFKKISGVHVSEFTVKGLNIITKGYPDL